MRVYLQVNEHGNRQSSFQIATTSSNVPFSFDLTGVYMHVSVESLQTNMYRTSILKLVQST